jgi:hypothetical protein
MKSALPAPSPQVLFTQIDDGSAVLLHLDTKFYYTLNRTGVVVWKALCEGKAPSIEAIGEAIAAEFRVAPEAATRDVEALLDELVADGLATKPSA